MKHLAVLMLLLFLSAEVGLSAGAEEHEHTPEVIAPGGVDHSVTYSPHAARLTCHMNMGPTGATAWMRGEHFVVMSIQQGSAGHGRLVLGDVVVGANGQRFGPEADPRMTLGRAIGDAQATAQPLRLSVLRQMQPQEISIDLPKLGAYASTWPAGCDKSRRILDQACQSLLDSQMPSGQQVTSGSFGTFTSGLLLLASGDPRYLDGARRAAHHAASIDYANMSLNNWAMGYGGILMAEYYLATGDDTVLPKLEEVAGMIAAGRMLSGTWGHKSPAEGYGALNQPGLASAIALVLARECGVSVDQEAIDHTLHFFRRFAGTGSVPYGDHLPYNSLDNNGMNGMAAVLFHLAGEEQIAATFAEAVANSYWMREEGHTGGIFSMIWGPLGAALAGEDKLQTFLDNQKWYYELARQWHGSITLLPYHEALTRFDDSGYIYSGGPFTTGGMALVYALPMRKLRILGAPPSVFGAELSGDLKTARDQYVARDWSAFDTTLAAIDSAALGGDDQRRWLAQLQDLRALNGKATDHVLMEIDANLHNGSPYRAWEQFEALKRCLGESGDPRFAGFNERFEESSTEWHVREGRQFYERWEGMVGFTIKSWVPQGWQARDMIEGIPSARLPIWEPLSPTSQIQPQIWHSLLLAKDQTPPDGWEQPGFDDSGWHEGEGIVTRFVAEDAALKALQGPIAARRRFNLDSTPDGELRVRLRTVRNAITHVYLNGSLIVTVERGDRGGYAMIPLHEGVGDLLKPGENVLAITSTEQGQGNNHLDLALEINRRGHHPRHLPVERVTALPTSSLPITNTSLLVTRETQRYREAMRQSYLDMSVDQLLSELSTPLAYYRSLAEDALVAKGLDGIKPALERMADDDWKTRAAAIGVLRKAHQRFTAEQDEESLAMLAEQIPAVTRRVSDEHFWVRMHAAHALGDFPELAGHPSAIKALESATNDTEEWVRTAALASLRKTGVEPEDLLAALHQAVSMTNSSFGIPRQAVDVIKQHPDVVPVNLTILTEILQQPPQGGGGRLLVEVIELACAYDPEGSVMIPLLIDAAADRTYLSRQRGNPRGKAIEALGSYGGKASAAIDTLKSILSDDSPAGRQQHEAARIALQNITCASD